jgi:hypothetical protein
MALTSGYDEWFIPINTSKSFANSKHDVSSSQRRADCAAEGDNQWFFCETYELCVEECCVDC